MSPRMVLFFASSCFDADGISRGMQDAFPGASLIGCSTAGELVSGRMLKNSLVAMAFDAESIQDVAVEVIEDVHADGAVRKAFASFASHYGTPMADMDFMAYVGIALFDGLCGAEERLMETMGDLTNVLFVGGSAGDDLKFKATHVYAHGKAYSKAAVLALLKPGVPFSILKTQSFRPLDKTLVPTRVNEERREVLEFDGKPAAAAYAEALGTTVEEAPVHFMRHPLGLMVDDEPFVRSPQQISGNSMIFYCNVREGMPLRLLESQDIVQDTRDSLEARMREMGKISAAINFHCILRTLELERSGCTEQYGKVFTDVPTIGFSTYGEAYLGHINQTSTILLFG